MLLERKGTLTHIDSLEYTVPTMTIHREPLKPGLRRGRVAVELGYLRRGIGYHLGHIPRPKLLCFPMAAYVMGLILRFWRALPVPYAQIHMYICNVQPLYICVYIYVRCMIYTYIYLSIYLSIYLYVYKYIYI